ncbi:MAG: DinB family protein [Phycisphaerae bacterium]|jgi:hypothetical protein
MNAKDALRNTIDTCHGVLTAYISDMNDADLMVRSVPGANHIAWQLGHLIGSERDMMTKAWFTMPALPEGFDASHSPETSKSDDPAKFHKKDEYLTWMQQQRDATMSALDAVPDADLDRATPEEMKDYAPTVGSVFNIIGIHEMMHAAQFVPIRRKLGKPIVI